MHVLRTGKGMDKPALLPKMFAGNAEKSLLDADFGVRRVTPNSLERAKEAAPTPGVFRKECGIV
jgi:hypothetical protein